MYRKNLQKSNTYFPAEKKSLNTFTSYDGMHQVNLPDRLLRK